MIKTRQRSTAALKNNASISLIPIRRYHLTRRKLCSSDDEKKSPLRLSNWKPIIWPSVFKTIRNWFLTFLIKGYLDASYTTSTFLDGAEQAVNFVSNCLSEGQLDDLKDLIDQQALEEAQHYLSLMSAAQKQQVAVNKDDMFLRYIHEIGMIFDDETGQRFVEITTVFQGMPGFSDLKEKGDPVRFQEQLKNRANELYICNYRFIREFTKGVDGDWKINRLNHFHPQEVVNVTPPFQR
ncbi:m-AAA protease-interacting protein 1, mitochondrial-like [Tubulanus polymorphus]|uniref:m-AAA protease-interacting protein 1, mitochondrial-like n=1 Tax=Tubulanus polymorphus TaxID=672921 RepID=UPI003DA26176